MNPLRAKMPMDLDTGDVVLVAAIVEHWLEAQRARRFDVVEPTAGDGPFPREKVVTFNGGIFAGRGNWGVLKFISWGRITIRTEDGQTTHLEAELDTKSSAIYATLWPLAGALALVATHHFVWAAVCVFIVFPVLTRLFAAAAIGSMRASLSKAIHGRISPVAA